MKKITVNQHDEKDCGAACLLIVARTYNIDTTLSRCRIISKTDHDGVSIYGLCHAGEKLGFTTDALNGNIDDLAEELNNGNIEVPFIAHIINNEGLPHYVVVLDYKKNIFTISDPANGISKINLVDFQELWTGCIVTFSPTDKIQTCSRIRNKFSLFELVKLIKGQNKALINAILYSLIIVASGIAGSFVFQFVIDKLYMADESTLSQPGEFLKHLSVVFIGLIFIYVIQAIFQYSRGCILAKISKSIDLELTIPYYKKIISMSISSINVRNTGDYISRYNDLSSIREAVSTSVLSLVLDTTLTIVSAVILYIINPIMFLIALLIAALYAVIIFAFKNTLYKVNKNIMQQNALVHSFIKETVDGVETVKSTTSEAHFDNTFKGLFHNFAEKIFYGNKIYSAKNTLLILIENIGYATILWAGFSFVSNNTLTLGTLLTFYSLLGFFISPIKNLAELQSMVQTAHVALERMQDVIDEENEMDNMETTGQVPFENGDLRIEDLYFSYGNSETILNGLTLNINQGQKVAIVGKNGCGKSTFAKILTALYQRDEGKIHIANRDINNIQIGSLRKNVAYISPDSYIFTDSIFANIQMGNDQVTKQHVIDVCAKCKLESFISKLPFGYDTCLEDNGRNLSSGQKQKLLIARALAHNAKILIVDETTSTLDTITETEIINVLSSFETTTVIYITHRVNVAKKCQKIFVMKDGKICEEGTHDDLISVNSEYCKLFNLH